MANSIDIVVVQTESGKYQVVKDEDTYLVMHTVDGQRPGIYESLTDRYIGPNYFCATINSDAQDPLADVQKSIDMIVGNHAQGSLFPTGMPIDRLRARTVQRGLFIQEDKWATVLDPKERYLNLSSAWAEK